MQPWIALTLGCLNLVLPVLNLKDADLLVVGTRGRSPWSGPLLGSVSQRCADAAACPVVLVKVPDESTDQHKPIEFE